MGFVEILLLVLSFFLLLALGVPIAWSLGIASLIAVLLNMDFITGVTTLGQQFLTSLDSFALLAIPFFILAGQIMNRGGIANRLIDFAKNLVGSLPGGLAQINIVAAMLFGAVSGSSVAAASAMGSILGPKMEKEGYSKEFGASINITSASMGLVIPPSNVMIVYSLASGGASIGALFLAGYIPGILTGLALMMAAIFWSIRKKYPVGERTSFKGLIVSFGTAIPSLMLLVIVIGGIVAGIFTATEAAAIAVVYTLLLSMLYRELTIKNIPDILLGTVKTTAIVMLLIAASISMSWVMSFGQIPQSVSEMMLGLSDNKIAILIMINLILLIVGMFMDMTPAILIFTPIFLPVAIELGINPIHFGIIMIMNLCIGICTPPVGTLLFVGISIAGTTIEKMIKPLIPIILVMIVILLIVTFWPDLSLWLPRYFELIR
jgi:tripartite ATP-independent transporter DctM subunit